MTAYTKYNKKDSGAMLVSMLILLSFLSTFVLSLLMFGQANMVRAGSRLYSLQAQYAAESGADVALAMLAESDGYSGTTSDITLLTNANKYKATFQIEIASDPMTPDKRVITSHGKVYTPANSSTPSHKYSIEVTAKNSSERTAPAGVMSRNILEVASSVKGVIAKDIFLNEYIKLNKNTNKFIAENITVAGKKTGANNCSIEGPGGLQKPASFTDPTQTRTVLNLAHNNCISPPGNASNADFEVNANQTGIKLVESTNIPWSFKMNGTYLNSVNGCSDWSSTSTSVSIPSAGNNRMTHYPNTSSGIAPTCKSSGATTSDGNIQLREGAYNKATDGSLSGTEYVIKDHIHVRASLCADSPCIPAFHNPTTETLFMFIEGNINFNGVMTSPTSGPIVMVAYGADPPQTNSQQNSCPLGQAVRLGQHGSSETNAPQLFAISVNGTMCMDSTKFPSNNTEALGGVSGKNLYISTNSGQSFDLRFNIGFPVEDIPIDYTWKASLYRRIF